MITISAPVSASLCEFDDVAIFATNSIRLGTGVDVTGSVVANNSSPGPVLDEGVELALDREATITGDATAVSVDLDAGASVSGTLTCDTGTPACTGLTPPVFAAEDIPAFLEADVRPGAEDVFVANGDTVVLGAGSLVCSVALTSCTADVDCPAGEACIAGRTTDYGDIVVDHGGTLVFAEGGRFDVRSITGLAVGGPCTGPCRSIEFKAPTELRVEGRFDSERGAYVGPAAGSGIDASDIAIYVAGQNGATGGLFDLPRAANVGRKSEIHASFYAPNGTFELERESTMTGAALAADVQIDKDSTFTGASAFANKAPTADGKDAFTNGQTSIAIPLTGSDPEGQALTFAKASNPSVGSVSVAGATATYTKSPATDEETSFTYTATDECGETSAPAKVRINPPGDPCTTDADCDVGFFCNVQGVCEPEPLGEVLANDKERESIEDVAITLILKATAPCEGDCDGIGNDVPLTFSVPATTSQGGTLTGLNQGTGELQEPPGADEVPQRTASVLYTPPIGFTGTDSFTFTVEGDVDGDTVIDGSPEPNPEVDTGDVVISVQAFTPPPPVEARDQRVSTPMNTPVNIALSGGTGSCDPADPDCRTGTPLTAPSAAGPSGSAPQAGVAISSSVTVRAIAERQALAQSAAARSALRFAPQTLASSTDLAAAMDIPATLIASSSVTGDPAARDARSNLGVILPTRGSQLAVLSTGVVGTTAEIGTDLGAPGTDGDETVLTLVLNVPAGNGLLSFDYNFLTAEYPEFVGSAFNDTFTVTLTDKAGGPRVIETAEVNFANLLDVTPNNAGGSGFDIFDGTGAADAGLTGIIRAIEPFVSDGQITLEFSIKDVGDGIYDSAVILDNVDFELQEVGFTILSLPVLGTLSYVDPVTDSQITITVADLPLLLSTEQVIYTPPDGVTGDPLTSFTYQLSDGLTSDTGLIELVVTGAIIIVDSCTAVGRPPGCDAGEGAGGGESTSSTEETTYVWAGKIPNLRVVVEGKGIVTSSRRETPAGSFVGLACDDACGAEFADGAEVVLYARTLEESVFVGWEGDCRGSEPITTVTAGRGVTCIAVFESGK